jgi:hypothetical protein
MFWNGKFFPYFLFLKSIFTLKVSFYTLVWTRCIMHPSSSPGRPPPARSFPARAPHPVLPHHLLQTSSTGNGQWLEESSRHYSQRQTNTTIVAFIYSIGNGQWLEESFRHCPHRQTPPLLFLYTPQGMGSDWKNLPGTTHTDKQTPLLLLYIRLRQLTNG